MFPNVAGRRPRAVRSAFRARVVDVLDAEYGPDVAATATAAFGDPGQLDPCGVARREGYREVPADAPAVAAAYAATLDAE